MRKIFTGEYIKALDKYTIEHDKVPSLDLIDRAASAFTERFNRLYDAKTSPVKVFAGAGNNGADALAIAYNLFKLQFDIEVFLFNPDNSLSSECAVKRDILATLPDLPFVEVTNSFTPPKITPRSVLIDGLFGCGLNRQLEGGYANLVAFINESKCDIVAIDLPSGLFADSNRPRNNEAVVRATRTFTFEFPKKAFFFEENHPFVGKVETLSIGLSRDGKRELPADFYEMTDLDVDELLRPRPLFAHKGTFGHALLIAGSRGKIGAAVLAAKGALRSGVGKLTLQIPALGETVLQTAVPEAMLIVDNEADCISLAPPIHSFDAVGIGSGIGQSEKTVSMLEELLARATAPMVLDADAINIIAERRDLIGNIPENSILTPHAKELERLTGYCQTSEQRIEEALLFAERYNVYVVLKGAYTATCTPGMQVIFNPTANPVLATPGSGDVLTGIITAFLAQGYPPLTAAILGVYLHGLAGNYYSARFDEYSLLASEIADYLPEVFKALRK